MPTYQYECENPECPTGGRFIIAQSIRDDALTTCPECGGAVERIIGKVFVSTPVTNTDLRDKGFAKLVKRDDGVYENVTRLDHEAKYMERGKMDTLPDISKRITD